MHETLVVDDNPDIRSLLQQALEMEGYGIREAENGYMAQKTLQQGVRPCLIFLDLMMPVMDGKQFLAWKNQQLEYAEIPVVIISATPPNNEIEGTKGYLTKPFDFEKAVGFLEAYCGRGR